jgi:hypothetical protein
MDLFLALGLQLDRLTLRLKLDRTQTYHIQTYMALNRLYRTYL